MVERRKSIVITNDVIHELGKEIPKAIDELLPPEYITAGLFQPPQSITRSELKEACIASALAAIATTLGVLGYEVEAEETTGND